MSYDNQLGISEATRCPVCLEPWTPDRLGDVAVCPDCWKSDDRTEATMRDQLGERPPWAAALAARQETP